MPRPKCCRSVLKAPKETCFRPEGTVSSPCSEEVYLSLDEYESLRLSDLEELYQQQAASQMNVSRQTFGRIIKAAHRKVADVIINGKILRIEGGSVSVQKNGQARCTRCRHALDSFNGGDESVCPYCRKKV